MGIVSQLYTSEVLKRELKKKREKNAMTEYRYYPHLTDSEIEERIKNLSPGQTKKFIEAELIIGDRRQALFVAGSWPQDEGRK